MRDEPGLAPGMRAAVFLVQHSRQIDVHELRADEEARSRRYLNTTDHRVQRGGFHADPDSGSVPPEMLDEMLRKDFPHRHYRPGSGKPPISCEGRC